MNDIESILNRAPVFKRIDDPWIGLLVLAIFIFVSSIIAIIVLCILWRRHKRTQFYNESYVFSNKPTGKRQIPIQIEDQQPKGYETQKMEVYVPQGDDERIQRNLGEIHARFTPHDGIQQVHQVYERTTKAYF